jgi:hypothetical protein
MELKDVSTNVVRRLWHFDSVIVGKALVVKDEALHNACRVAVSKYNKRSGRKLTCNKLDDGTLQVSTDASEAIQLEATNPTQFELSAFLASMVQAKPLASGRSTNHA